MPRPSYKTAPVVASPNAFIAEDHPAAWLERFAARATRELVAASEHADGPQPSCQPSRMAHAATATAHRRTAADLAPPTPSPSI